MKYRQLRPACQEVISLSLILGYRRLNWRLAGIPNRKHAIHKLHAPLVLFWHDVVIGVARDRDSAVAKMLTDIRQINPAGKKPGRVCVPHIVQPKIL